MLVVFEEFIRGRVNLSCFYVKVNLGSFFKRGIFRLAFWLMCRIYFRRLGEFWGRIGILSLRGWDRVILIFLEGVSDFMSFYG